MCACVRMCVLSLHAGPTTTSRRLHFKIVVRLPSGFSELHSYLQLVMVWWCGALFRSHVLRRRIVEILELLFECVRSLYVGQMKRNYKKYSQNLLNDASLGHSFSSGGDGR